MRKVLNVGGNNKETPIPPHYAGWEHLLLDIDPRGNPDIVCDARELISLAPNQFDSVYCSHNLEHYYRHDARKVLAGFAHVLKPDGFAFILVPDMEELMKAAVANNLDVDDVLYQSPAGPITVLDVLYGHAGEIEATGNDYYAHKTGFSKKSMTNFLLNAGFPYVFTAANNLEVIALAFLNKPDEQARAMFGLPEV